MRWLETTVAVAAMMSVGVTGTFPLAMAQEVVRPAAAPGFADRHGDIGGHRW
jgi:hypothetical protein